MKERITALAARLGRALMRLPVPLVVLVAILSLMLSGTAFVAAYFVVPEAKTENEGLFDPQEVLPDSQPPEVVVDLGQPEPGEAVSPSPEPTPEPEGPVHENGLFTFLAVATNDWYNTDTIIVARLDTVKHELNAVSIPRDTRVSLSVKRNPPKINGAYGASRAVVEDDHDVGIRHLRQELASVIGFYPRRYVMLDTKGFVKLTEVLGGVEFDVPYNMENKWEGIHLAKGPQTLDAEQALMLVRYRGSGSGEDLGRMKVQQDFLTAAAKQALKPQNITKIPDFIEIAQEYVRTDMDVSDMGWLAKELVKVPAENIHFYTIPIASAGSYVYLDSEEALALINDKISDLSRVITEDNVIHLKP